MTPTDTVIDIIPHARLKITFCIDTHSPLPRSRLTTKLSTSCSHPHLTTTPRRAHQFAQGAQHYIWTCQSPTARIRLGRLRGKSSTTPPSRSRAQAATCQQSAISPASSPGHCTAEQGNHANVEAHNHTRSKGASPAATAIGVADEEVRRRIAGEGWWNTGLGSLPCYPS